MQRMPLTVFITLFMAFLFGLLIAEGIVRFAGLASAQRVDQTAFRDFLGDLRPNQNLLSKEIPALGYHVKVNSQGFRGPELKQPPGLPRVLFLGDSITFGQYVHDGQTLPEQTKNHAGTLPRFEAINAGRCGYTIGDEWGYFNEKGKHLKPDWVVLTYTVGDIIENAWGLTPRAESLKRGDFRSGRSPLKGLESFFRASALVYYLQELHWVWTLRSGRPLHRKNTPVGFHSDYDIPPEKDYLRAIDDYFETLMLLRHDTEKNGAKLLVVLFPSHALLKPGQASAGTAILKKNLEKAGIPHIDLLEPFKASGSEEVLFYSPINNHPRAKAYQVAGAAIAEKLLELCPSAKTRLPPLTNP